MDLVLTFMTENVFMSPKKLFNTFATAEAVTWTLLISALVLRAINDVGMLVTVAGSIHGAVFLGYGATAAIVGVNQRWPLGKTIAAVALAIVPFATVPFERKLNKSDALVGHWRTTKSEDPRDSGWFDALFRFFIARPALLVFVLLGVLAALFSFLLFLGPPTEWFD